MSFTRSPLNQQAALAQYGQMKNDQATTASPHKMIAMLFDAAIESINVMLGAIDKNRKDIKGKASTKAIRIINGMRDLLDMGSGSEVAENLYSLYSYMSNDLFRASYENDKRAIKQIRYMLKEVQASWNKMPQAVGEQVETEAIPSTTITEAAKESVQVAVTEQETVKSEKNLRKPALGLRQSAFYS